MGPSKQKKSPTTEVIGQAEKDTMYKLVSAQATGNVFSLELVLVRGPLLLLPGLLDSLLQVLHTS